jgi:hypothetical protein
MAHKVYGGEDCYVACDASDVLHTLEAHYAPEKRACEWHPGLRLWASSLGFDCSMEAPHPQRLRLIAQQKALRPTPCRLAPSGRHSVA